MPRHGAESARRENRAAKETDKNTGQERQTQRQRDDKTLRGQDREDIYAVCAAVIVQQVGSLVAVLRLKNCDALLIPLVPVLHK